VHTTPPLGWSLLEYCRKVWCRKTRMVWLPDGEKNVKICLFVRARTACHFVHQLHHAIDGASRHQKSWEAKEDVVRMCEKWYDYMQPGWCQPVRQEFMENECEALPAVAYPGVRDNRSTINTKTGYDYMIIWWISTESINVIDRRTDIWTDRHRATA